MAAIRAKGGTAAKCGLSDAGPVFMTDFADPALSTGAAGAAKRTYAAIENGVEAVEETQSTTGKQIEPSVWQRPAMRYQPAVGEQEQGT